MAGFFDRLRWSWKLSRFVAADMREAKGTALASAPRWQTTTWRDLDHSRIRTEAYNANAAFGACMAALTFAFPEPAPLVLRADKDRDPKHPLQALLNRPNTRMSHSELLVYIIAYLGTGGNCYLHKVRSQGARGPVVQLWPYHDGHMTPVPPSQSEIQWYDYSIGDGETLRIPAADIVHLKWPMPDLAQPWMALPPLRQAAREVDTDAELTRMLYAFLKNDAPIRTIINVSAGTIGSELEYEAFITRFMAKHAGDNRGVPAVVEGANSITQLPLNLKDLDLTPLRNVPEARICAAMRVPPEVAGLSVGMEHSTYNNVSSADVRFTTRTLVPLWTIVAGELTQDLGPEFSGNAIVMYDIASIQALQKDEAAVWTRVLAAYDRNLILKNEARAEMGLIRVADLKQDDPAGDVFADGSMPHPGTALTVMDAKTAPILGYHIDAGVVSRNEARGQLGLEPEDETRSARLRELKESLAVVQAATMAGFPLDIALRLVGMDVAIPPTVDVTPEPPQLPPPDDTPKAHYPFPLALKAAQRAATEETVDELQQELEKYFARQYAAAAVEVG